MSTEHVRITLRIPAELHKQMSELAKEQERSLHKQMLRLMQIGVASELKKRGKASP